MLRAIWPLQVLQARLKSCVCPRWCEPTAQPCCSVTCGVNFLRHRLLGDSHWASGPTCPCRPVPDLPGKSLFFFSNEDFLEGRRKGLQAFLDKWVLYHHFDCDLTVESDQLRAFKVHTHQMGQSFSLMSSLAEWCIWLCACRTVSSTCSCRHSCLSATSRTACRATRPTRWPTPSWPTPRPIGASLRLSRRTSPRRSTVWPFPTSRWKGTLKCVVVLQTSFRRQIWFWNELILLHIASEVVCVSTMILYESWYQQCSQYF